MKKAILIELIILIITSQSIDGQRECKYKNTVPFPTTISTVLEFTNYYPGIRYDYQINKYGIYGLLNVGKYYTQEESDPTRTHIKSSIGIVRYLPNYTYPSFTEMFFGLGINYHWYENVTERTSDLSRISIDLNAGIRIKRYVICILYDVFKTERGATIGIRF